MTHGWDFEYRPIPPVRDGVEHPLDVVVATRSDVNPVQVARALADLLWDVDVTPLASSPPIHWTRIRSSRAVPHAAIARGLEQAGVGVRYVTSARNGTDAVAPALDFAHARPRRPHRWPVRPKRSRVEAPDEGHWFLGETGIHLDRAICGTGAGTRSGGDRR